MELIDIQFSTFQVPSFLFTSSSTSKNRVLSSERSSNFIIHNQQIVSIFDTTYLWTLYNEKD